MSSGIVVLLIVLAVVVVLGLIGFGLYNSLVRLRNQADEGWSQIDVQLQRRADLIPNLVETVKGYAAHESGTLESVVAARNATVSASTPQEAAAADTMLTGALRQVFALSENYPDLKASANFLSLQEELATTENKVAFARQFYNTTVRRLNEKIQTIPSNVIAKVAKIREREYFNVPEGSEIRNAPKVSFS